MRIVTFAQRGGAQRLGALIGEEAVLDIASADPGRPAFASVQALIEAGPEAWKAAADIARNAPRAACIALSSVTLLPPLPRPVRLRDCSLFLEHMEKSLDAWAKKLASESPDPTAALKELMASGRFSLKPIFRERVLYYNASHLSVSGPGDDVIWPAYSNWIDYELEWACVVGKAGRSVLRDKAREYIFGYTIFNDWSLRDVQMRVMDANLGPGAGKDFAGGNGLGPCIVTADEVAEPYALTMTAHVNGEVWSRGSTASMHHRFEDAISQFSEVEPLVPGEVIGSGTVLTGCGFELNRRLAEGDVVELQVESIGALRNRVVRA